MGLAYLRLTSFQGRILISPHLSKDKSDLWSFVDAYHDLAWWIGWFRYLGFESISSAQPGENVSSPHPTSRISLDAGNPSEYTTPLDEQAHIRIQMSLMRVLMCYLCYLSKLASVLPKFYIYFKWNNWYYFW